MLACTPGAASLVRACQACAVSKSKCVLLLHGGDGSGSGQCERCLRLRKECLAQVPVPRRQRRARPTRTAQLEEKLDGIFTLLKSGSQPAIAMPDLTSSSSNLAALRPVGDSSSSQIGLPTPPSRDHGPSLETAPRPQLSSQGFLLPASTIPDSAQEANILVDAFRTHMAGHFPFVVIPHDMTGEDLRRKKPFLYHTISMAALCRSVSRQIALRQIIMRELTEKLLIQNLKSLELLQGMLVFIAWYHYHMPLPQLTNLIQLALALAHDLGLNKPLRVSEKHEVFIEETKCLSERLVENGSRTLDERRAFLGVLWVSCVISPFVCKPDPMETTPYIEDCCLILESSKKHPSDIYLVRLVQLQIIVGKIRRNLWSYTGFDNPVMMYMKLLQMEIQQLRDKSPPEIAQNPIFLLSLYCAETSIFEVGFHTPPRSNRPQYSALSASLHELQALQSCVTTVQSFLNTYLSIPTSFYPTLPMSVYTQLQQMFIILSKLTLFDMPGWDASEVRRTLDLSTVLRNLEERFVEAGKGFEIEAVSGERRDTFSRVARKIRRIVKWYEARRGTGLGKDRSELQNSIVMEAHGEVTAEMQDCFLDDGFWQDMMSDWDAIQ